MCVSFLRHLYLLQSLKFGTAPYVPRVADQKSSSKSLKIHLHTFESGLPCLLTSKFPMKGYEFMECVRSCVITWECMVVCVTCSVILRARVWVLECSCVCVCALMSSFSERLTELIKQHFGVLELYKWFAPETRFGHETIPEKSYRADIRCTRLQLALRVFLVWTGTLGLRRFDGRTNSSVFTHPKIVFPAQVWMMGNVWEQQLLLHLSDMFPYQ